MGRLILLVIGFVAGWFLKDSNWEEWLEKLKSYFEPQEAPKKPIPLLEEKESKSDASKADEIFPDPLEKIKGIGPAIKTKLNENGVFTFAQLAALTPQELEEIVGTGIKRFTDEEEIIVERGYNPYTQEAKEETYQEDNVSIETLPGITPEPADQASAAMEQFPETGIQQGQEEITPTE